MKMIRIENLLDRHQRKEITISSIYSHNGILIDGISQQGKLYLEDFQIIYDNGKGKVRSIVELGDISNMEYDLNDIDDDNGGENPGGECPPPVDPCPPVKPGDNYPADDIFNAEIISEGYSKGSGSNQIIYPTLLADGRLVYDCSLGRLSTQDPSVEQSVRRSDYFDAYSGTDGYVELNESGLLQMRMFIPKLAKYDVILRIGSPTKLAKNVSFDILNNTYDVISTVNQPYHWINGEPSYLTRDSENGEVREIPDGFIFSENVTTMRIFTTPRSTNSNAVDCVILTPIYFDGEVEPLPILEGDEVSDLQVFETVKGNLYTPLDAVRGNNYRIVDALDVRFHGEFLTRLNGSELSFEITSPGGEHDISLLGKVTGDTDLTSRLAITINSTTYIGKITEKPTDVNIPVSLDLYRQFGGNILYNELVESFTLNRGSNIIKIKNLDIELTPPLLNSVILTNSIGRYRKRSNDFGKRELPNSEGLIFFRTAGELNNLIAKRDDSNIRNSIPLITNYDDTDFTFKFGVRNLDMTRITEENKLTYSVVMKPDRNSQTEFIQDLETYNRPKIIAIADGFLNNVCCCDNEYELGKTFNSLIDIKFYLFNYHELENFKLDPTKHIDTKYNVKYIERLKEIPKLTNYDIGDNWRRLYASMTGVTMAEKMMVYKTLENS